MRWDGQKVAEEQPGREPALLELGRIPGLLRTVRRPEFAGITFHEVLAKSALNRVPGPSSLPFSWTVNPYRGCSHACTYCFARGTHTFLDLDAGHDFDTQIVVKLNVADRLAAELARPSWRHETVALGTNTDPYQRAEGRYRLMPGIIDALAGSGTPFSILTKGTLLARDLPRLRAAAAVVPVSLAVSLALLDGDLQEVLEPGAPSPAARLTLIGRIAAAGLSCQVLLAPVVPYLTDSQQQLDALAAELAAAGASGITGFALHLRPGAREWFFGWLKAHRPDLVPQYRDLYAGGSNATVGYRRLVAARMRTAVERSGLGATPDSSHRGSAAAREPAVVGRSAASVTEPALF